jgi:hypothetical protein
VCDSISGAHPVRPNFPAFPDRPVPDISLASCDKLEEVHILLRSNKKLSRLNLLSSITSQKLRKISLSFIDFITVEDSDSDEDDSDDEDEEPETWDSLDATLGRLAEQVSKAEGKLILQLILPSCGPVKPDHILGQFLEHGEIDIDHAQRYTRRCKEVSVHPLFFVSPDSSTPCYRQGT